ncbi:MAG: hypothetical protein LBC59_02485 [Chitinispirillales bacterium]|jgi:hypothetical protein|nr:hypothetical protein [Chitinispirillales bacterium]
MSGGIEMLLTGFLAGGIVASVVWAIVVLGRRRATEAQKADRERIMASVGETLAEADAIETNFRSGALASDAFRRGMGERINAVMRLLRTNMHILDAYFVKYAEQEARDYMRIVDNPERRKHDGPDLPAAPIPGAVDKAAMYEQPFAVPAPAPAPVAVDTAKYELPHTAPAPIAADDFEPQPAPAPIAEAAVTHDDFAPQPAPAPAPIEEAAEAEDDFEPQQTAPAPEVADTADQYEPQPAPAPIAETAAGTDDNFEPPFAPPPPAAPEPTAVDDADDDFEPPPVSATETATLYGTPHSAPVREEELVLGESPEDMSARFSYNPPSPAPIGTSNFAPPPVIPPQPAPTSPVANDAAWSGGDSIEEFEAAFEQFEIPAATQTPAAEYEETGKFPTGGTSQDPPVFAPPPPNPQDDDHEFTETSSIDRGAILNAMAASGQLPSVQTPLSVPMPPQQSSVPENQHQGITGDDVADSIDNFFNLK